MALYRHRPNLRNYARNQGPAWMLHQLRCFGLTRESNSEHNEADENIHAELVAYNTRTVEFLLRMDPEPVEIDRFEKEDHP